MAQPDYHYIVNTLRALEREVNLNVMCYVTTYSGFETTVSGQCFAFGIHLPLNIVIRRRKY